MMDDDDLARARSQNNQNDYNDRVKTAGESPTQRSTLKDESGLDRSHLEMKGYLG